MTRHPSRSKKVWAASLALAALALDFTGCTSDQSVDRTPVGSVIAGKTDSASGYFQQVEEANKSRQQSGQSSNPQPGQAGSSRNY